MFLLTAQSRKIIVSILAVLLLSSYSFYAWRTASLSKTTKIDGVYDDELKLNILSKSNIIELLMDLGISIPDIYEFDIKRDLRGTKIIVDGDGLFSSMCWVVTLSDEPQVKKLEKPARISFVDEDCNFVAWTNDMKEGIHFANGETLPLNVSSRVGFDMSGAYLFVTDSGLTKILKASDPFGFMAETEMSATHMFLLNDTLYVFGYPGSGHFVGNPVVCQVFRIMEEKLLEQSDRVLIERPGYFSSMHVVDMDLTSKKVLLKSYYDPPATFLSSWYVYDLRNNNLEKHSRVEKGKQFGIFLSVDISG